VTLLGVEKDEAAKTLVRQALRYHYASKQDRDLLVAARHNAYAVALVDGARQFATDDEIKDATGLIMRDLWKELTEAQDRIEGRALESIRLMKEKGIPVPENLGSLPSEDAVRKLMNGEPGAFVEVAGLTLGRAFMISLPFFALKIEAWKTIVGSIMASILTTLFVTYKVSQDKEAKA